MYDFTHRLLVILVREDGSAEYAYHSSIHDFFFDVVPQVGDVFTYLWPDGEQESVSVIGRSLVDNWEYPDSKSWVLIVKVVEPSPDLRAAFEALRTMTRIQMDARGVRPRNPDDQDGTWLDAIINEVGDGR